MHEMQSLGLTLAITLTLDFQGQILKQQGFLFAFFL